MLEENCSTLKEQVNIFGQEAEQLREEQRIREANHEEEVQLLKNQVLEGQRHTATENIQLIQLHKENNHKGGQINTLRAQVILYLLGEIALKVKYEHLIHRSRDWRSSAGSFGWTATLCSVT